MKALEIKLHIPSPCLDASKNGLGLLLECLARKVFQVAMTTNHFGYFLFFFSSGLEKGEEASEQVAGGWPSFENRGRGGVIRGGGVGIHSLQGCLQEGGGGLIFFFRG